MSTFQLCAAHRRLVPALCRGLLFAALAAAPAASFAQYIVPSVCVEYPASTYHAGSYIARFSYVYPSSTTANIEANTASNYLNPVRNPPGETENFYPGARFGAFTVLLGGTVSETWHLTTATVTAVPVMPSTQAVPTPPTPSPTCPVVLDPATLTYTSAGTYNKVFLGQVESGPSADGVTLTAQPSPGISVSNLLYVPGDSASPLVASTRPLPELNPNSIYGTVTVAPGAPASSTIAVEINISGRNAAQALVPLTFTPPTYTITGSASNGAQSGAGLTVASGSTLPISIIFSYSGTPAPTGAITIQVDGSGMGLSNQTCTYKATGSAPHQNCSIAYTASGPAATHTLTFSEAADGNYSAFTGSATIQVTPAPASAAEPVPTT